MTNANGFGELQALCVEVAAQAGADELIEAYAAAHSVAESDICRMIREETYWSQDCPQMVVGPLEGAFLKVMALAIGAKRVLEIGAFTGYSALAMAEALPDEGTVLTCEIDADSAAFARRHWDKSVHGRKIEVRVGPALATMAALKEPFDLIFIDADKPSNSEYLAAALKLARPGAVIIVDNVVRNGQVADAGSQDPRVQGSRRFLEALAVESRIEATALQTVGAKGYDGFVLARVKGGE